MKRGKTEKAEPDPLAHQLWMRQPAAKWDDAFLLGNGRLGAIWLAGVAEDRLFLNHENLWRGADKHPKAPVRHQHLAEIREAFFKRDWLRGRDLCTRYLSGPTVVAGALDRIQPYQVFGQLDLTFHGVGPANDYRRQLRLADATAETHFLACGTPHHRDLFVSAEHNVVVLRVQAPCGALHCRLALTREKDPDCTLSTWAKGRRLGFTGRFREGIEFAAQGRVFTDGNIAATGHALEVTGADELLLILSMAVDYSEPDPAACCAQRLDGCPEVYEALRAAHTAEYAPRYNRCALDIVSPTEVRELPTDVRLSRLRQGGTDPGLFALAFNFGRYLLLSCSRHCEQPANLQGLWNPLLRPPWESDYHIDINLQLNYAAAESCNLSECAEPLFAFLERHEKGCRESARNYYNCRGIHMLTGDIWQMCWYLAADCDIWPSGAAWLAEHLWWRYAFSDDVEFLRDRAYPFLKGVAEFYEDFLIPHPETGQLVTVPSQSPENTFAGAPSPTYCVAPTLDIILIREVLGRCLTASRLLGVDADLRAVWRKILKHLPPFQVGKHGQLQEWLEDFDEAEPGHRHVSHLLGVFPGELMGPTRLPRFNRAAKVSLERRMAAGGGNTEWSQVWKCGLFARWRQGDRAAEQLRILLTELTTPGMLTFHPGPAFQIDGNLGTPGVIAEMLLQSHGKTLRLLPALPSAWASGQVHGLRARHGLSVDVEWHNGKLKHARLQATRSGPLRVAYRRKTTVIHLERGVDCVVRESDFTGRSSRKP